MPSVRLTPRRRQFLEYAIYDFGRVFKSGVPIFGTPYWTAGPSGNTVKLREASGDDLKRLGLIERVLEGNTHNTVKWRNGYLYKITDAGREAIGQRAATQESSIT